MLRPFLTSALLLFPLTPAHAGDPFPAALDTRLVATPAPIVQEGATRLYYEFLVTNFAPFDYVLESIEARAGAAQAKLEGAGLAAVIKKLGGKPNADKSTDQSAGQGAGDSAGRTIEGGRSVVVFLELDLGREVIADKVPEAIANTLHVTDDKGQPHDVVLAPVAVSREKPIVVGAPLRGEWIAGDSANNGADAAHRRAIMVDDGKAWIAQRYAIDWVQVQTVDGKRTTWKGPEDRNESYFCWDKPIYSVAAGKVVGASDGLAENVPHSGKHAAELTFNNAAGNHLVVEIAPRRYVLYAHMRPGTLTAKLGDTVVAGQVLGHVGNTGSSEEPHLHMHIDDRPSFLGGNGVPYEFAQGSASGPVEANVASPTAVYFGPIGPQKPFVDDYPAENALVTFK